MSKRKQKKKTRSKTEKKISPHVFLELRALLAVVGVRNAGPAADDAASALAPIVALVADADERRRAHERVADDALAVACFFFSVCFSVRGLSAVLFLFRCFVLF